MNNNMPSPDVALKTFFKNNEVFAALFNGYFFNNEEVIKADDLEPDDTAYVASIKLNNKNKIERINKYRDNIRRTSLGSLVILGIEDQDKIHYSMPVRKLLYDALSYTSELDVKSKMQGKDSWTVDEWLSKVKKDTKITPIVTVIFYTGEKAWDGPASLYDMMDIDDRIKPFVPDYPLYVIDMGHDKDLSFENKELRELKEVLSAIYSNTADFNETMIDNSILALGGILASDVKLYKTAVEAGKGEQKMCKVLEERDEKIKREFSAKIEAQAAKIDAQEAEIEAQGAEIEAQALEIAELKRQLASALG